MVKEGKTRQGGEVQCYTSPVPEPKLNRNQLEAVQHGSGPLLIIAGAGTGKTTVITERVKHLISSGAAKCEEILALTFTEKAAREMEERIDRVLPYGYTQMWVLTFHSFCDRVLRDSGLEIGLPEIRLLSDTDAIGLLKKNLFKLPLDYFRPLGNPYKFLGALLQHFSRLQDEDISPQQYLDWANAQTGSTDEEKLDVSKYQELASLYKSYSQLKLDTGFLDFSDLISYTLKLFRARPNILKEYQDKFKYILIDEFQDTNYAQNQLAQLLAGKSANLTVVGDDDQSVYRWRGAAISNMIQFKKLYPSAKLVVLNENFRSSQEILDRSYQLIQNNNPDRLEVAEKIDKRLIAARKDTGSAVQLLHYNRVEDEAEGVVEEIKKLNEDHGLAFGECAILVRANAHAAPFIQALNRAGIAHQFLGPAQLFQQPEIKDLISFLHVVHRLDDNASFFRLMAMPIFQFSPRDIAEISLAAKKSQTSLYTEAEKSEIFAPLINLVRNSLASMRDVSAGQVVYNFLQESGFLKAMVSENSFLSPAQAENIMKFFNRLKQYETEHADASVPAVVDWLDLSMEIGESPLASSEGEALPDTVKIITVHSAKGLEFPVVFMVNLVSQRFPSTERHEPIPIPQNLIKEVLPAGDYHLQEERRLFYVGMTRARDFLYFTAADYYGSGNRPKKLSPFIAEAVGEQITNHKSQISNPASIPQFNIQAKSVASREPYAVSYLSYSHIQTFEDCPLHYKARFILNIPGEPSAASSFGNTIHKTLRDFYDLHKKGSPIDIVDIYQKNWSPEGYIDRQHMELYFEKGKQYLNNYLKENFNPKFLPHKLEEPFSFHLTENLRLGGKLDRMDVFPDGSVEVVDYKTSHKSLTEKEAQKSLQLAFYALAANTVYRYPADKIKCSLYYFEEQKKVSVTYTDAELTSFKEKILKSADEISHSDFACSSSIICHQCDFKMLCNN